MAQGIKEIKRRIRSVSNTKKITRAMEMVAASKMRRAVSQVLAVRPYAHAAWSVLNNMALAFEKEPLTLPLLEVREIKRIFLILITSNRGLCGGFNSQLLRKVFEQVKRPEFLKINRAGTKRIESTISDEQIEISFITVGRKGARAVRKMGYKIIGAFDDLTNFPKAEDVRPLARLVMDEYSQKKCDKVVVAYNDYISTVVQQPKFRQILPISKVDIEKQLAEIDQAAEEYGLEKETLVEYTVEPNVTEVVKSILPMLVEMQIYHALTESNASKESARMVAMRNATNAASDMVANLTLIYNQIRQSTITQEIAEISAGQLALLEI